MPKNNPDTKPADPMKEFLAVSIHKPLSDLNTDERTLYELLVLIVDIKYRVKYGHILEDQHGKGYSVDTIY